MNRELHIPRKDVFPFVPWKLENGVDKFFIEAVHFFRYPGLPSSKGDASYEGLFFTI